MPNDVFLIEHQSFARLLLSVELRFHLREARCDFIPLGRRFGQLHLHFLKLMGDVFELTFTRSHLLIETRQFDSQTPQFVFPREDRGLTTNGSGKQRSVRLDQLALLSHEPFVRAGRCETAGRFQVLDHPRVTQKLPGERPVLAVRGHQAVCPADNFRIHREIDFRVLSRGTGERTLHREEANSSVNPNASRREVLDQSVNFFEHDKLRAAAECDFQQRGVFKIDVEQIGDTAENLAPRLLVGRPRTIENLADANAQAFLSRLQIFQHGQPRFAIAAPLSQFGQAVFRLVLICEQFPLFFADSLKRFGRRLRFPEHVVHARLATIQLQLSFLNPNCQFLPLLNQLLAGFPDGIELRFQQRGLLLRGRKSFRKLAASALARVELRPGIRRRCVARFQLPSLLVHLPLLSLPGFLKLLELFLRLGEFQNHFAKPGCHRRLLAAQSINVRVHFHDA